MYLFAGLAVALLATAAVAVASGTKPADINGSGSVKSAADLKVLTKGPAPALTIGKGWLNSKPLAPGDLRGKVVVYDFWTYSCINCVRTLPYVESWHERYAKDGLVVVGVHSPEFDFEKIHKNVAAAVKKLDVTYPVVFDDDMDIWNAFNNNYWPAKYITDGKGDLRYQHFGEGEYSETENVIRLLLGVDEASPRAVDPKIKGENITAAITPETYLGSLRGASGSPEELLAGTRTYTLPKTLNRNLYAMQGEWLVNREFIESTNTNSLFQLRYQAGEVNLVLDRVKDDGDFEIQLDAKPVAAANRGKDIVERDGKTYVHVAAGELYHLIENGPADNHILTFVPQAVGLQAYAFTFGT